MRMPGTPFVAALLAPAGAGSIALGAPAAASASHCRSFR